MSEEMLTEEAVRSADTEEKATAAEKPEAEKDALAAAINDIAGTQKLNGEKLAHLAENQKANGEKLAGIVESQTRNWEEFKRLHSAIMAHDKMQDELDSLRKGIYRQLLDPVLAKIAGIYNDYRDGLGGIADEKLKNKFSNLFDELEEMLAENDAETTESSPGEKFSPKYSKVRRKIASDKAEQHGTVAASISKGFHIGPRILVPEYVDVYVFTKPSETGAPPSDEKPNT